MDKERFAREFEAIADLAAARRRVLVLGHIDPDGDCIGSMLALSRWLIGLGSEVVCFTPGDMAELYRSLPLADRFVSEERAASFVPDIVFALDSPTAERTANLVRRADGVPVVNVDHHPTNERYGDINVVDETVSAAAILVYRMLARIAPAALTSEVAGYLYIGILMDTGGFRFRNTNAETFSVAARLVSLGARPHELAHDFLYVKKASTLRLLSRSLSSLELHGGGRIALMEVSQAMLAEAGGVMSDTEGFVDYAASIDDVELAALFREIAPETVRVSLRSRNDFDVAALAEAFGGGGHRNAAGLTIRRDTAGAKAVMRRALEDMLERREGGGGA